MELQCLRLVYTCYSTERFWWGFLALLQIGDLHLCSSCQHKVLGINVLRVEHSTSVIQMNMQPTPLFKMQTEHGPDSSAEFKTLQTAACSFHRIKSLERTCICS